MTEPSLEFHVEFDLIERNVSGTFDHDLDATTPGTLGELAQCGELVTSKASFTNGPKQTSMGGRTLKPLCMSCFVRAASPQNTSNAQHLSAAHSGGRSGTSAHDLHGISPPLVADASAGTAGAPRPPSLPCRFTAKGLPRSSSATHISSSQ